MPDVGTAARLQPFPVVVLLGALLGLCAAPRCAAQEVLAIVEVAAGEHDRRGTEVPLEIPDDIAPSIALELLDLQSGVWLPLQRLPGDPARGLFRLGLPLSAGETRRYELRPARRELEGVELPAVSVVGDEQAIRAFVHGQPAIQYNVAVVPPPDGLADYYARSGYLHPVWSPEGTILTEEFPRPQHTHQHGIFYGWVNTTFEGRHVDFWNQHLQEGNIEHESVQSLVSGDVFGQFTVTLLHVSLNGPDGPQPVLRETWTVRVHAGATAGDAGPARAHVFDVHSVQTCIAESPLTINEYHYGGMGWRGPMDWQRPPVAFLTSEGDDRQAGNHTRPRWVLANGELDGSPHGIAMLQSPDNPRFPEPTRLHPDMPYFVFSPPVLGEFDAPGESHVSEYRFVVQDGAADPAELDRLWNDYADPPRARVLPAGEAIPVGPRPSPGGGTF